MINIPCSNFKTAESISASLFRLMRPINKAHASDVTEYYCSFENIGGVWYLRFPESVLVHIDDDADEEELTEPIQELVNAGLATDSVLEDVKKSIRDNRGKYIEIHKCIPEFWLEKAVNL